MPKSIILQKGILRGGGVGLCCALSGCGGCSAIESVSREYFVRHRWSCIRGKRVDFCRKLRRRCDGRARLRNGCLNYLSYLQCVSMVCIECARSCEVHTVDVEAGNVDVETDVTVWVIVTPPLLALLNTAEVELLVNVEVELATLIEDVEEVDGEEEPVILALPELGVEVDAIVVTLPEPDDEVDPAVVEVVDAGRMPVFHTTFIVTGKGVA